MCFNIIIILLFPFTRVEVYLFSIPRTGMQQTDAISKRWIHVVNRSYHRCDFVHFWCYSRAYILHLVTTEREERARERERLII